VVSLETISVKGWAADDGHDTLCALNLDRRWDTKVSAIHWLPIEVLGVQRLRVLPVELAMGDRGRRSRTPSGESKKELNSIVG